MKQINLDTALLSDVIKANTYDMSVVVAGTTINDTTAALLITGASTLSRSVTIQFDPTFTPANGWSIVLFWRANMTIGGAFTLTVINTNYTTLLTGNVSQNFSLTYLDGAWSVSNVQSQINASLVPFTPLVLSVATRTGNVTLTKTDVGLANVDNTSDTNKPVSTAQGTAISNAQAAATAVGNAAQSTANTAASNATNALTQLSVLTALTTVATWAVGTQTVIPTANLYYLKVTAVNGNVTLNITPLASPTQISEITIFLGFTGSYTITQGANAVFADVVGSASVVQVLTLAWNGTTYIQKSLA